MQSKTSLELHFTDIPELTLVRTVFSCPHVARPIVGLRARHTPSGTVPFYWGSAAQALTLFFLKAVLQSGTHSSPAPVLDGYTSCPALTIARLLNKRTSSWLYDLFGTDASGTTLLARIVHCVNPRKRRPGPIELFIREQFLHPSNIRLSLNGRDISGDTTIIAELVRQLENTWRPKHFKLAVPDEVLYAGTP